MRKFGLVGFPLTHSFSKKYFEEKFSRENLIDCSYELFQIYPADQIAPLMDANPELVGLNVTIPYKTLVIQFLTELDDLAKEIGAVNCVKISGNNRKGYNTDAIGFEISLKKFLSENGFKNSSDTTVFVLGTGGSSKAIKYVLKKFGLNYLNVSREPDEGNIAYDEVATYMKGNNLFINTTPLGTFPNVDFAPEIPYHKLTSHDLLFDLVYNPEETLFLKKGKLHGAKTKNGFEMLQLQAEKSWEIWNS